MTERKYFSGNSLEQAVMNAARHFKIDPEDLDYRQMDKRHGFVKVRRSHVIEVNPERPRKPLSDDEAYKRAMNMDPEAHLGRDPNDRSYVTDDPERKRPGRSSRRRGRRRGKGPQQDQARQSGKQEPRPTRTSRTQEAKKDSTQGQPRAEEQPRAEGQAPVESRPDVETRRRVEDKPVPESKPITDRKPRSSEEPTSASAEDNGDQAVRRTLRPAGRGDRALAEGPAAMVAQSGAEGLLRLAALDLSATVYQGDEHLEIDLTGADQDQVTRRRGEVLAALQQLVPSMVRSETGDRVFCRVDCDGFREIHEERLRDLAQRVAGKVDRSGRAQVLESMNPAERRIIHMTLNDDPAVSTESLGKGYFKRVRISPS